MLDLDAVLNPEQRDAVTWSGGHLLILAGAGSGKTRVITHRIVHLVDELGVPPGAILAVTFTNKAATEMRQRVEVLLDLVGRHDEMAGDIGTFHATCARILRQYATRIGLTRSYSIYDDSDQLAMLAECAQELFLPHDRRSVREFHDTISAAKHAGHLPEDVEEAAVTTEDEARAELYAAYQSRMIAANAVDFGDLILHVNTLMEQDDHVRRRLQRRWAHILVDEFQDTNPVQYGFLRLLAGDDNQLTAVGDDDQSIYKWRGADPGNMLHFRQDYPDTHLVKLEQNYRSAQPILDAASDLIAHNTERLGKRLWTAREGGADVTVYVARDDREEARFIARRIRTWCVDEDHRWDSVAVFYRINAQSRLFEEQFRADGIPYRIIGSTAFYERREVKDLLAYLRALVNPADEIALKRIINTPSRGIGPKTIEQLEDLLTEMKGDPTPGPDDERTIADLSDVVDAVRFDDGLLDTRAHNVVVPFAELMADLREMLEQDARPSRILQAILDRTEYLPYLDARDPERAQKIRDHVSELLESILAYEEQAETPRLAEFLERVSLGAAATTATENVGQGGAVSLMTIHGAKGLEFDVVFVAGLEDDLLPYRRRDEEPDIEEERRLCYVAFTRARERLYLSLAKWRRLHGTEKRQQPSRFLRELEGDSLAWLGQVSSAETLFQRPRPRRQAAPHPAFNAPRPRRRASDDDTIYVQRMPDYESESQVLPDFDAVDSVEDDGTPVYDINSDLEASRRTKNRARSVVQTGPLRREPPSAGPPSGGFDVGDTVQHRIYGIGEVLERDERADGVMLTVSFQAGEKKIFERFLRSM